VSLLLIAGSVYLLYTALLWWGVQRASRSRTGQSEPSVSVVIAARNEAKNIGPCLAALAQQTYPQRLWQVIVVDDRSTDETAEIASRWRSRLPGFSLVRVERLPKGKQGKKNALEHGIEQATGEIILTTDADCQPPPTWIEEVARRFGAHTDVLVGYSPLRSSSTGLWARALELDALASGIVAAAGVGWKTAITASGRNLAYRRRLFHSSGGFAELHRSVSGDDDLLLHRMARADRARVAFLACDRGVVPARAPDRFRDAMRQKLRHLSAGRYYPRSVLAGYAIFYTCNAVLWGGLVAALFGGVNVSIGLGGFAAKLLADAGLLRSFARRLRQPCRLRYLLPWEIYLLISSLVLSPVAAVAKVRWKECR
jgi:cellulose synthase/poly-beta-1,6-N-acetylglucosamine synthase-like glycosyltransferase